MCLGVNAWVHVLLCVCCVCVCLGMHVHVGGNGLICLCILTMFIRAADAALMRNTFVLILLPHVVEIGGGALRIQTACSAHTQAGPFDPFLIVLIFKK